MKKSKGFTIAEVLVASSIAILVMSAALSVWIFLGGIWNTERIKSDLLGNMQIAMERMKQELMFSDGNKTLTADNGISFPNAKDGNGDGFIELDSSNKIIWDETIVYHVYNNNDSYELRKTVYSPRNNTITTLERQAQLEAVITTGSGTGGRAQGENSVTNVIISGLKDLSLEISPMSPSFDGYASTISRSQNVSFGSALLDPGYHTISFEVTGKNADSSGYGIGIDTFSITPGGYPREAEDYMSLTHLDGSSGISASSGDTLTKENMTSYGVWSGNYQMDYASNTIGDYITLRFYYDSICETNFSQGSLENVAIEFTNEDGAGGTSGSNDYILSLEGNESQQTQGTEGSKDIISGTGDNTTYRVIILSPAGGRLCSFKFAAGSSASLTIEKAYLSKRESGQDGGAIYPVTFNNCNVDPRNSGQGVSVYNGGMGITIPQGKFGWSNWIDMGANIEAAKEYFVTFFVKNLTTGESMSILYWLGDSTRSYTRAGDYADTEDWGTAGTEDRNLYGIKETAVRYVDRVTFTSQIYDTGMDDPQFDKIIWNIKRNNAPDADVLLKIKTNSSYDALASDTDWSSALTIDTGSAMNGNADISAAAGGRYAQFQAEFFSYESNGNNEHQTKDSDDSYENDEDYDMSCILKDVTIVWPGQRRIVDVSGYYTLEPDYGKFTVKIDGESLTKGLEAKLTASKAQYDGADITESLNAEVEFRNTNK